jgi:hypothetical protein
MPHPKIPDLTGRQNTAIEKEVAELMSLGVPEWQARETAAINLGFVKGDVIEIEIEEDVK